MIYLDNASTTQVDTRVIKAMESYFRVWYGNPGSVHGHGLAAKEAVSTARRSISSLLGCDASNIIFTSGGSEGNSMVFNGVKDYLKCNGKTDVIISSIEHESVMKAAKCLEEYGFRVLYVRPEEDGRVRADCVRRLITEKTGLVSVMFVNNETGVKNNSDIIGGACRSLGVLYHADCVQGMYDRKLRYVIQNCDFATFSAHKIHGPKGVGAVYARDVSMLRPTIFGGNDQEYGKRGGTENVPGIAGFGEACNQILNMRKQDHEKRNSELEKNLLGSIGCGSWRKNAGSTGSCIVNLCFDGVDAQTLVALASSRGLCISAGSACSSHETSPSHVLKEIGLSDEEARSSVRISFSKKTTNKEASVAGRILTMCVNDLRSMNGYA